jgi:hypothetical protein
VRGWQRAGAIACLFAKWTAACRHPGLTAPQTIYASAAVHHSRSLRPQHTVKPLAAVLGITLDTQFAVGEEPGLAQAAQQAPDSVLIAWHHEAIPALANAILGSNTMSPQHWPEKRFDVVWVFDRAPGRVGWRFSQVPQMLLAGDSPNPI